MSRRGGGGSVRGSLHDSFPCITGADAERLTAQLNEAVAGLGALLEEGDQVWAAPTKSRWSSSKAAPSPFEPRIEVQAANPGSASYRLIRVSAAVPARGFTLSDAQAAFAFLHIHTHAPQIVQSLFSSRVELARELALLPLSSGSSNNKNSTGGPQTPSPSKIAPRGGAATAAVGGGGPDSSVLRLVWATGQRKGKQPLTHDFVLAQRTGRIRGGASGGCVFHVATAVRDPDHIPVLAAAAASPAPSSAAQPAPQPPPQQRQQPEGTLWALLVGHSAEQGCLQATLLASGGPLFNPANAKDAGALRSAHAALVRYLVETVATHKRLRLSLPDCTLALISPFATVHRILLRMPEASQQQQHHHPPSRLSSASTTATAATPPTTYRVVSIRFLCASSGVFTVSGLAPQDQALLPTWIMEKILRAPFSGGEAAEVRFVASSETKELTLVWAGLGKGRLHRYIVDVKLVHRSALSRTLALLEAAFHLPRAGATHAARRHHAKATSMLLPQPFDVAHIPTQVSVVRRAQHLQEQRLPLALALPVAHTTIARPLLLGNKACNKYKGYRSKWAPASCCSSYAASLSAGILQHLIIQPGRVVGCLDALWPLLLWSSFYVFLHTGLRAFPEFSEALDGMPLWGLALGLGLVHLSLGLTLHALVTSKVLLYLRLAALEFHVLTPRWWWRLLFVAHTHGTVAATLLVGLAARVMTLRGGLAEGEWLAAFLLALQLESLGEDKLLLLSGMAALSLLVALAVTSLHLLAGSNRQLNVGLIVLLDRLGVLRPLEAPASNLLHPFGRHHAPHRASSSASATGAHDSLAASSTSSLDASSAVAAKAPSSKEAATPSSSSSSSSSATAAARVSSSLLRKGLANALSPPAAHKQGKPPAGPATPNISSVATYTASTPSYDMTTTSPAPVKANKATTPSTVNTATNHGSSSSSSTRASLISVGVGTSPFPQPALQHAIVGLPATPASCCSSMAGGPASPASKADTPARQHEERELPPRVLLAHASNSGSGGGGSYCASLASEGAGGCGGGGVGERGPPQDLFESAAADRPMAKSGAVKERRPTGSGVLRQRVWKDVWLVLDADFLRVYKSKDTDNAVVHHRLPILEVGVRRIVAPDHAGFALYGPGVSGPQGLELRCDGGDSEADKWVSAITWNALVAGRRRSGKQG